MSVFTTIPDTQKRKTIWKDHTGVGKGRGHRAADRARERNALEKKDSTLMTAVTFKGKRGESKKEKKGGEKKRKRKKKREREGKENKRKGKEKGKKNSLCKGENKKKLEAAVRFSRE